MKFLKFCTLFLLVSCTSQESIVGLYGKCKKNYFACSQLELKADKTFEYFVFMDVGGANIIKGNWKQIAADSIVLNTFEQPKNLTTTYIGKINPERKGNVKITITETGLPLSSANIIINNDINKGEVANINGMVEFETQRIQTITYYFLNESETIIIDNPNYNEIEIKTKNLNNNIIQKYLTNEVVVIDGKKLFFQKLNAMKKTSLKNKQW